MRSRRAKSAPIEQTRAHAFPDSLVHPLAPGLWLFRRGHANSRPISSDSIPFGPGSDREFRAGNALDGGTSSGEFPDGDRNGSDARAVPSRA